MTSFSKKNKNQRVITEFFTRSCRVNRIFSFLIFFSTQPGSSLRSTCRAGSGFKTMLNSKYWVSKITLIGCDNFSGLMFTLDGTNYSFFFHFITRFICSFIMQSYLNHFIFIWLYRLYWFDDTNILFISLISKFES
jgi:hypothetical protein